jgi:hypothetical protein
VSDQTHILNDIVKPIEAVLQGKDPTHAMAALGFLVASTLYQGMMPKIGDRQTFDNAMTMFRRQVQENLVMLMEANKGPK